MIKLGEFHKNIKGSIVPSIAVILILLIMVTAVRMSTMLVYRNRTMVRDALDAAVTSALTGAAEEEWRARYYYESYVCLSGHYETKKDPTTGETYRYFVCDAYGWRPYETDNANYIKIDKGQAESVAIKYFEKNLDANLKDYKIIDWDMSYEYDSSRYLTVTTDRSNTGAPSRWWYSEFGDSSPSRLRDVDSKDVRFPRWVRVTIDASIEVPRPYGSVFGDDTQEIRWTTSAVKELKRVDD